MDTDGNRNIFFDDNERIFLNDFVLGPSIEKLNSLSECGLSGIIIGKALYENKIILNEIMELYGD